MGMILSPSILSCDFTKIGDEIKKLKNNNIKYIHLDVMDGVFVDNISFGLTVINSINQIKDNLIFDTHLMITNPIKYVEEFRKVGSDIITFHYEATNEVLDTIMAIKKSGAKVGLSIKPNTDVEKIYEYLKYLDIVLLMSVEPGFGGKKYIESTTEKIKKLSNYIKENNYNVLIEVDGGITANNAKKIYDAGANILVSGSYIFNGKMEENIKKINECVL